jgi:hypothetical protein
MNQGVVGSVLILSAAAVSPLPIPYLALSGTKLTLYLFMLKFFVISRFQVGEIGLAGRGGSGLREIKKGASR